MIIILILIKIKIIIVMMTMMTIMMMIIIIVIIMIRSPNIRRKVPWVTERQTNKHRCSSLKPLYKEYELHASFGSKIVERDLMENYSKRSESAFTDRKILYNLLYGGNWKLTYACMFLHFDNLFFFNFYGHKSLDLTTTLLLLIFAGLNFRDFQNCIFDSI